MSDSRKRLRQLCGPLIVGGFEGTSLPAAYAERLERGERGGAILFRRNIETLEQTRQLCASMIASSPAPLLLGVDQEGGRVSRLPEPFFVLPSMRKIGAIDDLDLTRAVAEQVARELRALGFNLNFAPVVDVDSNPDNPVIGDRCFGSDPRSVMRHAVAFIRGLQHERVLACAKHFPGHGDTSVDSHLDLPVVERERRDLMFVELPPFRAASGAGVAAMMSAHVVYPALDADVPATFSRAVLTSMLRREMGFEGVLFSDDLEMGAVSKHQSIEEAATEAVWAGCDALLICKDLSKQDAALDALVERASRDDFFRKRCEQALGRVNRIREVCPPQPAEPNGVDAICKGMGALQLRQTLSSRLADLELQAEESMGTPDAAEPMVDPTEGDR